MTTDGPYIPKTFGSASPRGRREVVSTVDRGIPTDIGEDSRNSGLRRLKSRSWGSIRRWEKENELLFAMIEDESEWLAELFPDEIIAPEFFFFALEDGVLLCKLANLIQEYAEQYGKENNVEIPECHLKYHPRSKTRGQLGQFRARENVTAFLGWCRRHQVPEVILFESNDVVQTEDLREGAREVVICLMEVARRSFKYGVKPPKLIILEKEIDEEERTEGLGSPHSVDSGVDTEISLEVKDDSALINSETHSSFNSSDHVEINNALNSINGWEDEQKSKVSTTKNERADGVDGSKAKKGSDTNQGGNRPQSELDRKVLSLIEEYSVGKILRLKEGKYIILGRVMFVRMLNEHVLVRIGGGWDGLEHYLMTHVKQGSQSQNPPSTPAANVIRSTTPINRPDTRRTNKPLSPAASTISLAESKKDEFLPFTPPLQAGLISRGRESPLRKTSRVKDTDEADITRAIRRIENTVSENIQKKTNSNSALDLTASVNNCKSCSSSNRKLVPRKMATSEFADFSSNVNENGEYYRLEKDTFKSEPSDCQIMDKKVDEGETPILNGDLDTERKHPADDGEASGTVDNCMHVVITKKESEEEKEGEKRLQEPQKMQGGAKEAKSQSKSAATGVRPTGNTKTSSKVDKKTPTSKKTTAKSATTTAAKLPLKSVKEKKTGGAAKSVPAKPIFKVSTVTSSTVLESKSISTKASISKSAAVGSKSAGVKSDVAKTATSGAKQSPGKAAPKPSAAAAKTASVKADPKSKKEEGKKVANGKKSPGDDATDGAVLSTKAKVNGVSKVTAQTKSKTDAQTPKASASAKSATSTKAKSFKANGKASSVVDKTKEKTSSTDKVPAKTAPVSKSDQCKSASTVKLSATDSKSKKPTTPSTAKTSSAATKANEVSKKPATASKPSSAPSKTSVTAKSSKQPSKSSSAPSSATATKSTPAASKSGKPTAKVPPSTIGEKKPTASKVKSTPTGNKDKVATSSSKAPAAKSGKESKTSKPASAKSTKVEKKDNKKAPKATADKNKKDIAGKHVSKGTVVVEQKEKININSALTAPVEHVEVCDKAISESIKDSTEAFVVQSTERAQSDETEATELIIADKAQLQSEGEPSKLSSQIVDNQFEQGDESSLPIADGNEISNGLLAQDNDEVEPRLEQFDSQPVEIKSSEDEFVCKEAAKEEERSDVLSSPTQSEDKANIEGNISSPSKLSRKDTYSIGEVESQQFVEDDKQKVTCEEGEDVAAKGDSEEQDAESAMFDESKLISLEEISAKCDEDDVREGAVAPTPPETPVPDSASAEASAALEIGEKLQFETASVVLSVPEEMPTEADTVKSEVGGSSYGVKDTDVYQLDEAPSVVPDQDIPTEVSPTVERLNKDNADDGEDSVIDNTLETEMADGKYPEEDSSQLSVICGGASDRAEDKDFEYEHEALKHDVPESSGSTVVSHSPYVDDTTSDFLEPFETQGIYREAQHRSIDTEISDEAEVEKELESSSDVEMPLDNELPAETNTLENFETLDGSEGPQTSDFSQEIGSSQSLEFSSDPNAYQEDVGDNVSPNEQNEPYFIGSKGTEELMQREAIEQEKIGDAFHGSDEPSQADISYKLESEARDEKEEDGDIEEEQEDLENGENVESYGISVNEVAISVTRCYDQEAAITPVNNESHLPESSAYDSVLVNAQDSETYDMETVVIEQGHNDNYAVGDNVLVTADAGQNEILNPDIGLQENGNEEEKAQDSEEYKDAAHDEEEMEDTNEDTLKHLDLERQEADSSLMEDQFTPISDLTDDLRSPLAKDSFSNFASEGQEEREYEDKSDVEEEEFNSEAIELARESVRVARSLDDSCEEVTPPSNSQALEDDVVQRFDGDLETEDQGMPAQREVSPFPSTTAPQVISSPCLSSDGEDFEEEEMDQGDRPSGVLVDIVPDLEAKNHAEDFLQNSPVDDATADPVAADQAGFPDAATAETLSDMYRAEAESHDLQFGYERQLCKDQDMDVPGAGEEPNVDEDGIKSEKFIIEPGDGPSSDSYIEGHDTPYSDQGVGNFSIAGETEKFPGGDGTEETPDNAMELQRGFDDASHDEFGNDAQFENDEGEVGRGLDEASFDVMQNEGLEQDFENSLQSGFLEQDMRVGDVGIHAEEVDGVVTGTQFHGIESTSYEEMERKCDESREIYKEKSEGILIASTTEEEEVAQDGAFEDHMTSSIERSDAERNIQSDDQTTDSSDFVLVDSPVKQVRAGNSDEVIAENDVDPQDILQASLKESESGDSPFHHIELKTDETEEGKKPDEEALHEQVPDDEEEEEALHEEAPDEEALREEPPDEAALHEESPDEAALHEESPDEAALHEEAPDGAALHEEAPGGEAAREETPEEQADYPPQEDLSGKGCIQNAHFFEEKSGTRRLEDQMLSVSSTVEEQSNDSRDIQMNSSQSPNLFWQTDMREVSKEFRSDPLEKDEESKMKFNTLMNENLNTGGPRYVYDGSDEDGEEDYDDDETY